MVEIKIEQLLQEKFKEPEFSDCYLVDLSLSAPPKRKLSVFLDSDSGITFDTCKQISRYLEAHLDEQQWLGDDYILEVSSPGLDRPLKLRRQYIKNIGRKLKVTLKDGQEKKGKLLHVEDDHILLEHRPKGKKEIVEITIPFDQIEKTLVTASFK